MAEVVNQEVVKGRWRLGQIKVRQVGALAARETAAAAADQADRDNLRANPVAQEMAKRVLDDLVDPADEMPIANLSVSMDPRGHE